MKQSSVGERALRGLRILASLVETRTVAKIFFKVSERIRFPSNCSDKTGASLPYMIDFDVLKPESLPIQGFAPYLSALWIPSESYSTPCCQIGLFARSIGIVLDDYGTNEFSVFWK